MLEEAIMINCEVFINIIIGMATLLYSYIQLIFRYDITTLHLSITEHYSSRRLIENWQAIFGGRNGRDVMLHDVANHLVVTSGWSRVSELIQKL